jgi:hypothetical protein
MQKAKQNILEDALLAALPATYYSDRPIVWRVCKLVSDWQRLTRINQELERRLAGEDPPFV